MNNSTPTRLLAYLLITAAFAHSALADNPRLALREGDRIVFVGNTFAERMRHYGYFETRLMAQFPELQLTFRNLGWSADEVNLRPRPLNFGDIHEHLERQQASVIFLCFGINESFKGEDGLIEFRSDLRKLIELMQQRRYNRVDSPRLVLVSPIPQEPFPGMPDVSARNRDILLYTQAMREIAEETQTVFLDLYEPAKAYQDTAGSASLTFNGIHMEAYGYWVVSQIMLHGLGLEPEPESFPMVPPEGDMVTVSGAGLAGTGGSHGSGSEAAAARLGWSKLSPPPPPPGAEPSDELLRGHFHVKVANLPGGAFALSMNEEEVTWATREVWAHGLYITEGPLADRVESLRSLIVEKNQLFFDRWRAVNGYYIYGGRKEPFGVVSFPPEMERFDELVADLEAQIADLASQPFHVNVRIAPVDR